MVFYTPLALLLLGIGCLCLLVAVPQMIQGIEKTLNKAEMPVPPKKILLTGIAIQNIFMLIVAVAIGTLLASTAGLDAPVLRAVLTGDPVWSSLKPQLLSGLIAGLASTMVFMLAYYMYFIRHLDFQTWWALDNRRLNLKLSGRLLYNGVIEEIIARWGLMSLFVWLGSLLTGKTSMTVVWLATLASGAGLALLYLPDYYAAGSLKSWAFFACIGFMYLWTAVVFGWLFWCYGLGAAIFAHIIFQLAWYPYDMRLNIAKKLEKNN